MVMGLNRGGTVVRSDALRPNRGRALGVMVAGLLAFAAAGIASADTSRRVEFRAGTDGAEVSARIAGYEGAAFVVGARAGQTMIVEMETSNLSANFNVTAPGADQALFIGSTSGTRFEGVLPVSGDYRIEAYLMRNAARRNETADVRLSIRIPAGGGAAVAPVAPQGDFADGLAGGPDFWEVANLSGGDTLNVRSMPSTSGRIRGHLSRGEVVRNMGCTMTGDQRWCEISADAQGLTGWVNGRFLRESGGPGFSGGMPAAGGPVAPNGQPFDATGTVPCARYPGEPTANCAFGVQRRGPGSADVFIAFPDGGQRLISFADGEPRAADAGAAVEVGREADLWFVRIGDERYEIPDAVVTGG